MTLGERLDKHEMEELAVMHLCSMFESGQIDVFTFLQRIPDGYVPNKDDLIKTLEDLRRSKE